MSESFENRHVYIALYDFKAEHSETLSLKTNEKLLMLNESSNLSKERQGKKCSPWSLVQNTRGNIGYVPTEYITSCKVPVSEELDFVEGCIEAIHIQATCAGGKYTNQQHTCLQKLVGMRSLILDGQIPDSNENKAIRRKAPPPPVRSSSSCEVIVTNKNKLKNLLSDENLGFTIDEKVNNECQPVIQESGDGKIETIDSFEKNVDDGGTEKEPNFSDVLKDCVIPESLGLELIEVIRSETGGSHKSCVSAASKVVALLSSAVPLLSPVFESIFDSISNTASVSQQLESEDGKKMITLFEKLEELKEGGHELNWNINNDEGITIQHVTDLINLLAEADPEVSRSVLKYNGYTVTTSLVTYYRMEHNYKIRDKLVQLFQCFSFVETKVIGILATSILPLELSREILACSQDEDRLCSLGNLMMTLFSTGESIPVHHYEYLNCDFVDFVLDLIDKYDDSDLQTADILVALLLAFNLHFKDDEKNVVIEALTTRGAAKSFTEKTMLLINREDDPVLNVDESSTKINSVIKLVLDMFDSHTCCQLFYTNDVKVLIDIVLRQISDLGSTEKMRHVYLKLLYKIIVNSDYFEHRHQLTDIQVILNRIAKEEECDQADNELVATIKELIESKAHN